MNPVCADARNGPLGITDGRSLSTRGPPRSNGCSVIVRGMTAEKGNGDERGAAKRGHFGVWVHNNNTGGIDLLHFEHRVTRGVLS